MWHKFLLNLGASLGERGKAGQWAISHSQGKRPWCSTAQRVTVGGNAVLGFSKSEMKGFYKFYHKIINV